jgi:aminoglycoside phosphotransferase (APT) family kinase protein
MRETVADDTRPGKEAVVVDAVRQALAAPDAVVERTRLLAGGAMHQWWAADVPASEHPELVVRLSPPARDDAEKARTEYAVLTVMRRRGVRVARPLYVGENAAGQTFMVSERVAGDTNPRRLLTAPELEAGRKQLLEDLAHDLALIHTVRADDVGARLRGPAPGEDPLAWEIGRQEAEYGRVKLNPHPLIVWALRWLRRNAAALTPTGQPPHVVHGDFRIGNILYTEAGLGAILDWEGVGTGEAEYDLAWFCTKVWRFNRRDLEAGGIATRDAWVQAYERHSGRTIDRERLRLYEVLGNVRWAIITMMQAKQHLDGWMDSHEHAAIGRRTADTELEVLRLTGAVE